MAAASRSRLLAFCRSLPHVTEDVKWGNDLVFSVGKKMFAGFSNTGKDATFGCKVPEDDFAALTRCSRRTRQSPCSAARTTS